MCAHRERLVRVECARVGLTNVRQMAIAWTGSASTLISRSEFAMIL